MGYSCWVMEQVLPCIVEELGRGGDRIGLKEGRETGSIGLSRGWGKSGMQQVESGEESKEVGIQEVGHEDMI